MKLPEPIFDLAKQHFAHHGCWHEMRGLDNKLGQELRDHCFADKKLWPHGLQAQGRPGSGQDFLRFHRMMIRHFKWVIKDASPPYQFLPWNDADFPCWVTSVLDAADPFYRLKVTRKLDELIAGPKEDDLGMFIEEGDDHLGPIHSFVHGIVHDYEECHFGKQVDADMGDFKTAAYNEHFWRFHGWIDEIYGRWQTQHMEKVDQTPLKPDMHVPCSNCAALDFDPVSPWLRDWREYLKSRF